MNQTELAFAGIARQAELVRAGKVKPTELVSLYCERIGRLNPTLNCFRRVFADRAMTEAEQAEARLEAGDERPLLGVPVAIKDNVDVAGDVTTHGTSAHGPAATEDSGIVKRIRAAGAIVLGRTTVPELCMFPYTETATFGRTLNPWSTTRVPGGSSGGPASAVAAGLVGASLGSDGGGSIRIPASCCGLFGMKSQRDRFSLAPDAEHWHGLSVVGPLTRTVADSALFFDAVAGNEPSDPEPPPPPARPYTEAAAEDPERLRIAVSLKVPPGLLARVHPDVRRAVEETADRLRRLGHEVVARDPDYGLFLPHFLARYLRGIHDDGVTLPHPDRLERRTRGMIRLGGLIPKSTVVRVRAQEEDMRRTLGALWEDHDVLLTPTLASPPVKVGKWEGRGALWTFNGVAAFAPFCAPWNVTGQPAASVPAGFSGDGLPIGVQLVGRPNDEDTLFSLSGQLERDRDWAAARPPLAASGA